MIPQNINIGTVFSYKDLTLKCVESGEGGCNNCAVEPDCARGNEKSSYSQFHKFCFAKYRLDNTSVKFVKTIKTK